MGGGSVDDERSIKRIEYLVVIIVSICGMGETSSNYKSVVNSFKD